MRLVLTEPRLQHPVETVITAWRRLVWPVFLGTTLVLVGLTFGRLSANEAVVGDEILPADT